MELKWPNHRRYDQAVPLTEPTEFYLERENDSSELIEFE